MIVEVPAGAPRLSLRWTHDGTARDVVGHLVAANDEWLVLLPEDRAAVWVPRSECQPPRVVPERQVLPASREEDLERALERARPATRRARLGGWRLSDHLVLAVGDPGDPLAQAVREVEEWGGRRPSIRTLRGSSAEGWAALGYLEHRVSVVLTADSSVAPMPGAVALSRGWALEVDATDEGAREGAVAVGFMERHRAVTLIHA